MTHRSELPTVAPRALLRIEILLLGAAAALSAGGMSPPVVAAAGAPAAAEAPGRLDAWLGTERHELRTLEVPSGALPGEVRLPLELDGRSLRLRLRRHSVRAPGFRLLVAGASGERLDVPAPPPRTYRGEVEGEPDARVAATLLPEGWMLRIARPGLPVRAVRPLRLLDPGAGREEHVVYWPAEQLLPGCGVHPAAEELFPEPPVPSVSARALDARGGGGAAGDPCPVMVSDVAFDSDWEFFDEVGGRSEDTCLAVVEDGLAATDLIYVRDVGIRLRLSALVIRSDPETDPYGVFPDGSDFGGLLVLLREHWNSEQSDIDRDSAYLLTAKSRPEYGGLAYVGTTCGSWAYGVGIGDWGYDGIYRHELGHNWSCGHDCGTERRYIMCGNSIDAFSGFNAAKIRDFLASRDCVEPGEAEDPGEPPLARPDIVWTTAGEGPVAIDLVGTDSDSGCDGLDLAACDERSAFGAEVRRVDAVRADGPPAVLWIPRSDRSGTDFFRYTVRDGGGLESEGVALVRVRPRGIAAHFPLDETSGDEAEDLSDLEHEGELRGDLEFETLSGPGRHGRALELPGDDDVYLSIDHHPALDLRRGLTVAAWFRVDAFSAGGGENLVAKGSDAWRLKRDGTRRALRFTCDGLRVVGSSGGDLSGIREIEDADWHHAVGVWDGQRLSLWIDGELDASLPATGLVRANTSSLRIGSEGFQGAIDDVRVLNHGLGEEEVRALWAGGRPAAVEPAQGSEGVVPVGELRWTPGPAASAYDVYLGADAGEVAAAAPGSPLHRGRRTGGLERVSLDPGQTWHWRLDAVVDGEPLRGPVRRFTTARAWTDFSEAPEGATTWTPAASDRELAFRTEWAASGGASVRVGVTETSTIESSPVFSHRSVEAVTTFGPVPLDAVGDAEGPGSLVSLWLQVRSTGYEDDDSVSVRITDGSETVDLVRLEGSATLGQVAGQGYDRYSALAPREWTSASLVVGSRGDSSQGSERYDFDRVTFSRSAPVGAVVASQWMDDVPEGAAEHHAPGSLGFATESASTGGASPRVGVVRAAGEAGAYLSVRSVRARTTFDAVDLSDRGEVRVTLVLRVLDTGYETSDYLQARLTRAEDTADRIDILDLRGDEGLDGIAGDGYLAFSAEIPAAWDGAVLSISSQTNSSAGAEGIDLRGVEIVEIGSPTEEPPAPRFRRGDVDASGAVDITDGIALLGALFLGDEPPACADAADANDSESLDLSDAVRIFMFLFAGGAPPPAPGPFACGPDPDGDLIGCAAHAPCDGAE